jgi:hypothetical protein
MTRTHLTPVPITTPVRITTPASRSPRSRTPVLPSPSEKTQTQLLGQLYELNIPDNDIALVVTAMRGHGTNDEQGYLLQRLYALQIPSAMIAQLVDAMRRSPSPSVELAPPVDVNEPLDDPPPMYDFNSSFGMA